MNTTAFDPGPLADASVRRSGDRWTLVFARTLRHPPAKVWAALTEPAQLTAWAPYTADRDLGTTGSAVLTMIDSESPEDSPAQVTRAEPPTLLEYTWGTDVLRWELGAVDGGTKLVLSHTVTDRDWAPKVHGAWHLHQAWPGSELVMVPDAGHAFNEPGIRSALLDATDRYSDN